MPYKLIETHRCFDGVQSVYSHWSESTKSEMHFALFLPSLDGAKRVPVLYWLSGLTCSEQNFITKAGAQRVAAQLGIALVVPDTSPRLDIDMPKSTYLGEGASFYVDATQAPWKQNYQMYTYISQELPSFIARHFPVDQARCGILGHSMGGHGALVIGLRNPQTFQSISAFAPIASVIHAPWGIDALTHYLGSATQDWSQYDAAHLLKTTDWPHGEILIDQGGADPFLAEQLKPHLLEEAVSGLKSRLRLRLQAHFDHSYYFVSTFLAEHVQFHRSRWSK